MPQNVRETFDWAQFLAQFSGLLLMMILIVGIPVAVLKTPAVWNRRWKRWAWSLMNCLPGVNLFLAFPALLATLTWKATRQRHRGWHAWPARIAACLLSPVLAPFVLYERNFVHVLRKDAPDAAGEGPDRFRALRRVASVYAAVIVAGLVAAVFGRPPAVGVERGQRATDDFSEERRFIFGDASTRPDTCVSLSGGGIRSAAFSLGALHALHDLGILRRVDVISAVSGGTYALSWLVLQPYYAQRAHGQGTIDLDATLADMFSPAGPLQRHLWATSTFVERSAAAGTILQDLSFGQLTRLVLEAVGAGHPGTAARQMYARQIQFTFHRHVQTGAGTPAGFTNDLALDAAVAALPTTLWDVQNVEFSTQGRLSPVPPDLFLDSADAPGLQEFLHAVRETGKGALPFPVFNASLKVDADADVSGEIWPSHFEMTPLGLGGPALGYVGWKDVTGAAFSPVRSVNVAPAISGAAISGYSQVSNWFARGIVRFLNLDLGYRVRNFSTRGPRFIYVSDGGHTENLGLYALIRRGCQAIVAVDAEHEAHAAGTSAPKYEFLSYRTLAKALSKEGDHKLLWNDGDEAANVSRNYAPARFDPAQPVLEGRVEYPPPASPARLVYIKLALDRRQTGLPEQVVQYLPEDTGMMFPHDPTTRQQYTSLQFKAYQALGYYLTSRSEAVRSLGVR